MASLHAIAGPLKGVVFQLHREEVSVGRQASNHLCVGDPSVSRQHCLIVAGTSEFLIRDLGSNNGTFVNGERVEERALSEEDKIRICDSVFRFVLEEMAAEQLGLADNKVVTVTAVEEQVSDSAETAIQNFFERAGTDGHSTALAKAFLKIGAALNDSRDPDTLQLELLKLILEVVPAERAAIILLAQSPGGAPTIAGWDARCGEAAAVPVSRTLISKAIKNSLATFSDDVTVHRELSELSSLATRRVVSVVAVPLIAETRAIGAIYLDSADPVNRLARQHLEFAVIVGEYAGPALERAIHLRALKEENRRLQSLVQVNHNLICSSQPMRQIIERTARIARTDATVVIRGETGTGKELVARAIHQNSTREGRPFEAINCALLRETLLDSELFGHEKGSFTGAIAQKKGKLELADGGTLFLDELAELGEASQAMLLRVLQTREFQRLGGNRTIRVDIRIIAATNENLEQAVKNRAFREDLYYRLNVVSITLPPLRERREDIPLLVDHFVQMYGRKNKRLVTSVSREAMALLMQYDWPGNVRELENAIEHAVVFGLTAEIHPEDLPGVLLGSPVASKALSLRYHDAVCEAKRSIVRSAIAQGYGNYAKAASLLGIHANNLHRLMRDLKLKPMPDATRTLAANAGLTTVE